MALLSEDDFLEIDGLDDNHAFLRLDKKLREAVALATEKGLSDRSWTALAYDYLTQSISAADELNIVSFAQWQIDDDQDLAEQLVGYQRAVDKYAVRLHIRRAKERSPAIDLNQTEKREIRHFVDQIKEAIEEAGYSDEKRDRLMKRLNEFLAELDKTRLPREAFGNLMIYFSHTIGESAKELEPTWKWLKLIGAVLGAKVDVETKSLPKMEETKQLPAPEKKIEPK